MNIFYPSTWGCYFLLPIPKFFLEEQIRAVLDYISIAALARKIIKQAGVAEARHILNYPFEAIEEAVVNAYYHRSYELGNPIEINIWPDKIEILSYPGPLPPVDSAMLKRKRIIARDYRNRRIADFLKELRLTEGRGTGIPKIHEAMTENGSPSPVFETDADHNYFLVTLPINPAFLSVEPEWDKTTLQILKFCQQPKSRAAILENIGVTSHSKNYKKYIISLMDIGLLSSIEPHKPKCPKQKYYTTEEGRKPLK